MVTLRCGHAAPVLCSRGAPAGCAVEGGVGCRGLCWRGGGARANRCQLARLTCALHCLQARNAAEFRRAHAHMPFIAGASGRWLHARTCSWAVSNATATADVVKLLRCTCLHPAG